MQYSGSFKTIDTPASSSYYSCFAECFAEYLSIWSVPPPFCFIDTSHAAGMNSPSLYKSWKTMLSQQDLRGSTEYPKGRWDALISESFKNPYKYRVRLGSAECSGKTNRSHLPECHLNDCFSADNTTSNFISSCIKSISKLSKDFLDLYIWLMWSQSFTFQRDWCDHLPQNHLYSFHLSVWWIISTMLTFCLNIPPPSFVDSAFYWCFTFVCFLPVMLERFKKKRC